MTLRPSPPPLRDKDHNGHAWGMWYENLWKNCPSGVNRSYRGGDEDAEIDFNNGMASIKLEYLSSNNTRNFLFNERARISRLSNTAGDFGTDTQSYGLQVDVTYTYGSWSASTAAGMAILAYLDNNLNDTLPELCGISSNVTALTANSKAGMYGMEAQVVKLDPCAQANTFIGIDSILLSDVDPGIIPNQGAGFRAFSADPGALGRGVRQHSAFYAAGGNGWKYGFLYLGTLGESLFAVDQNGGVFCGQGVSIAGDYGGGTPNQLRLTNAFSTYVDGSGQTAPYNVTGGTAPVFAGWVKAYTGNSAIYLPAYTGI